MTIRPRKLLLGAWALVALGGAGAAAAQQDAGCLTKGCHPDMATKEFVHGPVGVGACTICHRPEPGSDHRFKFAAEKEELCLACHEDSRDLLLAENVHTPVARGQCTACHDPHQSDFRYNLKGGQGADLCFQCHEQKAFEGDHIHPPVEMGDCNACHDPHASAHPRQLVAAPADLCVQCHTDKRETLNKSHVHKPVQEGCTKCHQPHTSQAEYLLQESLPALCITCHQDLAAALTVSTPHPPVAGGRCTKCHDVHASDFPVLLAKSPRELCFSCHKEMGTYVAAQDFKHGPLQEGDCNACHNPHGSDHHRILRQDFPTEFYTPYAEAKYAMCFECHNHQIAMEAKTKTLTDFRDGDRNLHFVHVNKEEKGRSCRACHQVHASSQAKHIRTSVPYGTIDWELPVTYTKTKDGGSCQVGCHAPKEYKR